MWEFWAGVLRVVIVVVVVSICEDSASCVGCGECEYCGACAAGYKRGLVVAVVVKSAFSTTELSCNI